VDVLELRSDMDDALASGDPARRSRVERVASERRAAHVEAVRALFATATAGAPPAGRCDPAILAALRRELNAWRYVERMREALAGPRRRGRGERCAAAVMGPVEARRRRIPRRTRTAPVRARASRPRRSPDRVYSPPPTG
jgi:hypothetical protein